MEMELMGLRHGTRSGDGDAVALEQAVIHHRSRKSWRILGDFVNSILDCTSWGPNSGLRVVVSNTTTGLQDIPRVGGESF